MEILEEKVPTGRVTTNSDKSYAEKQLLDSYMPIGSSDSYDCQTCNNCGSGDCSSCCGSTDD